MSWMDSCSRPPKHAATPPPLYLTHPSAPYCHTCGRVIGSRKSTTVSSTSAAKTEVKYCSARCRGNKPGALDRRIEDVFVRLLSGEGVESVRADGAGDPDAVEPGELRDGETGSGKLGKGGKMEHGKKHKKKGSKSVKGEHRILVDCTLVEELVFNRTKDPEKVYGRRKNRRARFVVERPEDWRSVDMVDDPPASTSPSTKLPSAPTMQHPGAAGVGREKAETAEDASLTDDNSLSDTDSDSRGGSGGGIALETSDPHQDIVQYGYGSGLIRPPQPLSVVNGSIGGEKGWAERVDETEDAKLKRREGQRRADEREMVRRAARRGVAFGFLVSGGEGGEGDGGKEGKAGRKKCEAVMKGSVVEASFAKGEWGVRWREGE